MCGIAGWFDTKGERPADRNLVQAMTNAIAHRGPDGEAFFFAPGIGFGHRRLAVIDLVTGDQPMFSADGSVCIIFNGEIYNFKSLRAELQSLGRRFVTQSDTEVIIQAWQEWGPDCVTRLTGMFALALWDANERALFLARDRLGEKPLYYALQPDMTLLFGSELKALKTDPTLARDIDPCAVEEFFALGYIAEPRTIYAHVHKLAAGSTLLIRRGQTPELRTYWDPHPAEIPKGELATLEESLIDRLGAIVKSQLVADVPVGAFVSGGVDSSGTMALMARASADPITAFSIGFNDDAFDETRFARQVAQRYHAHHIVERMDGTESSLAERLPAIFDEPFGDSSALPSSLLMQLARKSVTVALSGDGGDELFAGYRRYGFHAREEFLRRLLPGPIREPLFGAMASLYPNMDWAPRFLRARHTFRELSVDSLQGYFWNVSVVDDEQRSRLFSRSLRKSLAGYHASQVLDQHARNAPTDDPVTRAQYVDLKTWLPGDILTKVDRTAMACSLEVRVPMLDHGFVDWALGLPLACRQSGGQGKIILKHAFERLVPREVLYRPKQGFSVPLAAWFRGALGQHFRARLEARDGFASAGYIDRDVVERLMAQHQSGAYDHSRTLWLVWMFEAFMERESQRAPAPRRETVAAR
jgi:asparagine synthase (glutamine-hydrolysing)